MLIGEYIHPLDDKNRLSLPSKFRKEMGKEIVVTPGLDNCLFIFTKKEWNAISQRLSEFSMLQQDNRSFHRYMFGGAQEASVDSSGRILVPDFLKSRAGLEGKVAVVGVQNRIELWNEEAWNKYRTMIEQEADSLAEKLGGIGAL
jgi:MraZ protein